ncbi:MAG: hypothetical protein M3R15_00235, partial [Acidobacteriota bacterium]|nr:hypothetical protein [Acidobacteriota bacterium]
MEHIGLLYFSAAAGFIIVLGSIILIWKGRILIDTEEQTVTEVELPLGFRVKTQMPFVIMFLFGAFLLALPLFMIRNQIDVIPTLVVTGKISSKEKPAGSTIKVYATVDVCDASNEIMLKIPFLKDSKYNIVAYANETFAYSQFIKWDKVVNKTYELPEVEINFNQPNGGSASRTLTTLTTP